MLRVTSVAFAATLFAAVLPVAQSLADPLLEPAAAARGDRLYPGFAEIVEVCEPISLERLTRVLLENASADSLAVFLGLLEHCPHWSATNGQGDVVVVRLRRMVLAAGELPFAPVARVLRTGNHSQRRTAAMLLSAHADLIPERDRGALDQTLIETLSDPDMRIREMVVGRLRAIGSAAGQAAIARALNDPNVTGTFRSQATGTTVVDDLLAPGRLTQLRVDELVPLLTGPDPDVRGAVAERIAGLQGNSPANTIAAVDQERIVTAMIGALRDPSSRVRMAALPVLWRTRAPAAVAPLIESLNDRNVSEDHLWTAIGALAAIGSPEALPALERLARPSQPPRIREAAASAYIKIAKPADAASDARRLLWEAPDTALEKDVLARGRAALPRVWDALATGSANERRIAAALLGSFPDVKSVRPILTALAQSPGAVTRDQLLFDLNMILLTEGAPAPPGQRNAIASAHWQWLRGQIVAGAIDENSRAVYLGQPITVFPDRVSAPFSTPLSMPMPSLAASPDAFRSALSKATGLAFHEITVVDNVARAGATLYLRTSRGVPTTSWIGLYRRDGNVWLPMGVSPSNLVQYGMINRSNLQPTINRDYGADEPLKRLRFDLTMERIRVDLKESELLRHEKLLPNTSEPIDRSYAPLLERYRRSDMPSVRYTAEFESTKLTGEVNIQLWIDTLAQSGTPYQQMAQQVVAGYARKQLAAEGRTLAGAERDELVAAAINPEAVDPGMIPRQALQPRDVRSVRRSDRFASVVVAFDTGGYTMLFELRKNRWVFLCIIDGWIS